MFVMTTHLLPCICTCAVLAIMMSHPVNGEAALEPREPKWEGGSAGMVALYNMQNGFLNNLIQYKTIGELLIEYNIDTFSDLNDPTFTAKWTEWIMYGIGYMVCISLGLVLIILIPIAGQGVCCARTCKCCKCCCTCCCCTHCTNVGKAHFKGKKWKKKLIGYSVTLGCLSVILLASITCAYVSAGQLKQQVGPYGLLDTFLRGLYSIDNYTAETVTELDTELLVPVQTTIGSLNTTIANSPEFIVTGLGIISGLLPDMLHLQNFAAHLDELVNNLTIMDNGRTTLFGLATTLNDDLLVERSDLTLVLSLCAGNAQCDDLSARMADLSPATYYASMDDISAEIGAITAENNVADEINTQVLSFWDISIIVQTALGSTLNDVLASLGKFEQEVSDGIKELQDALQEIDLSSLQTSVIELKPSFNLYGSYTYWGVVGILMVCTVIIFCYILGLILGLVLPSPSIHTKSCSPSKNQGGKLLLAGIGITFVFSWLLMLLTVIFFTTGGFAENNLCRHLVPYDESMDQIEILIFNEFSSTYNISIKSSMLACQANQSVYTAGNLEANGYNITAIVDLNQYGIYTMLDGLRNASIPFPPPTIITGAINGSMISISIAIGTMDLDTYVVELGTPIMTEDLTAYIADLETLAQDVTLDNSVKIAIEQEIGHLNGILSGSHQAVVDERAVVQDALDHVDVILNMFDLPGGLGRLTTAQDLFLTNSTDMMQQSQDELADTLQSLMEALSDEIDQAIRYHIGGCRVLFDAGTSVIDGGCVYFLEPYNAFWFCIGWFMIFSMITVAIANELAYVFGALAPSRKIVPFSGERYDDERTIDEDEYHYGGVKVTPPIPMTRPSPPPPYTEGFSLQYALPLGQKSTTPAFRGIGNNKVAPYVDEDAYLRSGERGFLRDV